MATKTTARTRGAALILTLIVLSTLTILLVAFLSTMRTERRAAVAVNDAQRAKAVAGAAVNHAIDLLRTNIPDPARLSEGPRTAPAVNWATNPGQLSIITGPEGIRRVPLHTGEVTDPPRDGEPRDAESVDLNQPLPGQTVPVISGLSDEDPKARPPMRVKWFNLQADPGEGPGPHNPLVSRYAFWMDDETARLNFNTASGKPALSADSKSFQDADYARQVSNFLTPTYALGTKASSFTQAAPPQWALGRPQSVNLDVLFDKPGQFRRHELTDHLFLHGYERYPEALFDFLEFPSTRELLEWYQRRKFDLTFYNRGAEFNAFNRSRFFTTYVPLSLEAGPNYQHPFIFDPSGAYDGKSDREVLHLNTLLGTFGFTSSMTDEDGAKVDGGNVVNRMQLQMLSEYLHRQWPGHTRTFAEKYGEAGVRQLALNMLLMARMGTTQINTTDVYKFSQAYALRTTSANYSADSTEMPGKTPERMYWRFSGNANGLFLPQIPGPHITEVRLCVRVAAADPPPKNDKSTLIGLVAPRYLQYWYEVEYYMHGFGPVVELSEFPVRMDYFELDAGSQRKQQFGPATAGEVRFDADWTEPKNLGRLIAQSPRPDVDPSKVVLLGPQGSKYSGKKLTNRVMVSSAVQTVGQRAAIVPFFSAAGSGKPGDYSEWDPVVFDAAKERTIDVAFRMRPGMSIHQAPGRPRQMIPLGESREDTLKAKFPGISLLQIGRDLAFSWQIDDPRLSHLAAEWEKGMEGPGNRAEIGTPGLENRLHLPGNGWTEATESSAQKSKFRYLLRAPADATIDDLRYDRGDEYSTASRVSSPGYWSLLHTGMQSGKAWQTLNLGPEANQASPPDWLLLDLVGATYPMANDQFRAEGRRPDEFSTPSFMNSTAGQVNLNTRIYPRNPYFNPPSRRRPIMAVFKNLPNASETQIADAIDAYQADGKVFDYVGKLGNVLQAGTIPWQSESVLRNMAGALTTKSNTFGMWGVAQVVKKVPANRQYERFERGDQVLAEKRFHAIVERYLWAGRDGVPGNAHAANGKWDRLALQSAPITNAGGVPDTLYQLPGSPPLVRSGQRLNLDTAGTYPVFDGPEAVGMNPFTAKALGAVRYQRSSLAEADNPPQAVVKYRVVAFRYLDE